jgi:glycosyltransferase involved in cell wall biosynthesis
MELDTHTPRVSICIPTWNGSKYIGDGISSVLAQTLTDFELIVVDDNSTDSTDSVVESFRDPRLSFHRNSERLGLVGNWNRCLELASCEYVTIFHQDDVMAPENLAEKVRVLEREPQVGFVYSRVDQIDKDGNSIAYQISNSPEQDCVESGMKLFETLILNDNHVRCPSVVARRTCYETVGDFDSRLPFTADWEMWMRIALFYDVAYLSRPLAKYRCHAGNETGNFLNTTRELEQYFMAKKLVLEKHPERVVDSESLLSKVTDWVAEKALNAAEANEFHQRQREAREHLLFAIRIKPVLAVNKRAQSLAAKLLLGQRGTKTVINLKQRLAKSRGV